MIVHDVSNFDYVYRTQILQNAFGSLSPEEAQNLTPEQWQILLGTLNILEIFT